MPLELAGERYPSSIAKAVIERLKPTKSVCKSDPNPCIGERSDRGLLISHEAKKEMVEMTPLQARRKIAQAEIEKFERNAKRTSSRDLLRKFTR